MSETIAIETVFDDESLHVGQVYAKAILAAAESEGKVDMVVEQLKSLVVDVMAKQASLAAVFADPKRSVDDKINLIDRAFGNIADPSLLRSLKVIARRRRLPMLPSILQAVLKMRDQVQGRLQVIVTSAAPLDGNAQSDLQNRLQQLLQAQISLTTKVDPAILGGLVIRVGDTVFDGSVDNQLEQMRKTTKLKAEQSMREKLSLLIG
jgi:F-type H+-transporting ATPase subunit delta